MRRMAGSRRPLIAAVFGDPVAHSLSPAMHGAAFRALGLPGIYLKFRVPVAALSDALAAAGAIGFLGVNLTIPLKEAAFRLVDSLTPEARRAGSVNTVTFGRDGRTEGHTTDGGGFLRSLREDLGMNVKGKRAVLLGAGGAAHAVAFALAGAGAYSLTILDTEPGRARRLAGAVRAGSGVSVEWRAADRRVRWREVLAGADLLVNATPVGMKGGDCPVPPAELAPPLAVADLVYNPPVTRLVREARRRGVRAMNGEGMLVNQGALSFERWTGIGAPVGVMRRALRAALRRVK